MRPFKMIKAFTVGMTATAMLLAAPHTRAEVAIDWVTIGNAGNAPDTNGYGAVAYEYRISKYEVTNAQYTEFLNAVARSDFYGLYNTSMAIGYGGITRSGSNGNYSYSAIAGRENHPVIRVNWYDTLRFANWLHNGQPDDGGTGYGAYTFSGSTTVSDRNPGATVFLPSDNEWYKAAFHDASAGTAGVYFGYANSSNSVPDSAHPADNPAGMNYRDPLLNDGMDGGYAIYDPDIPGSSALTDVGAYTDAPSPYGTFDQGGSVAEWNEAAYGTRRIHRGGSWSDGTTAVMAHPRFTRFPLLEDNRVGFRVASIVPIVLGDMDGDGSLTNADIAPFVMALTDAPSFETNYPGVDPDSVGDFTGDGSMTNADIAGFVAALTSTGGSIQNSLLVPEPGTLALLLLGAPLIARRRRVAFVAR